MFLPSELLASYIEKRTLPCGDQGGDDGGDDQAEEILSQALGSIGRLPDIGSSTHACAAADTLASALMHGGSIRVNDDRTRISPGEETDDREWESCLSLLRHILSFPESITDPSTSSSSRSRVPPHVVLRMVIDHSLDLCEYDESDDYDQEQGSCSTAAPITTITTTAKLLTLLGVASIRLVAREIRCSMLASSSPSSSGHDAKPKVGKGTEKIRWRRASSMTMECIGLYQDLILPPLGRGRIESPATIDATALHCRYLAPAVMDMLSVLQEGDQTGHSSNSKIMSELIQAGLVAATASATRLVNAFQPHGSDDDSSIVSDLSLELVQSSIIPLSDLSLRLDTVLLHPLRQWEYERRRPADFHEEENDLDYDDFTALVCGSSSVCNSDKTGGMQTYWDSVGIAFMAYHILMARFQGDGKDILLPYVVSPQYSFELLYPHVEKILALGQNDDDGVANDSRLGYIWTGIDMLSLVLNSVEHIRSDELNSDSRLIPFDRIRKDAEGPLGPVGNVQLLLNIAVAVSNQGGSIVELTQQGHHISKSQILDLIRKLFSCYPPIQHVTSIGVLLDHCPYPFVESVLLDLLRPALVGTRAACSSGSVQNTGNAADSVEDATLKVLYRYIDGMKSHMAQNDTVKKDSGLAMVNDLLEMVEQYTCTASLIRLLFIRRQHLHIGSESIATTSQNHMLDDAVSVLADLHARMRVILDSAEVTRHQDDTRCNYFQLHLLADALREAERSAALSLESS